MIGAIVMRLYLVRRTRGFIQDNCAQYDSDLCYSFLPAEGVERIIRLRARVRQRLQQNAEVVGADETFFEDQDPDQAVRDLFTEKAGILDGEEDAEVDLASYAYQIWKNTTFALMFLPRYVGCVNFVNPDLIAKGLSPFVPQRAMIKAGRLVLQEIRRYTARRENFAIETTLSGRVYLNEMRSLKNAGYSVHAFYLWIPSPEFAIARIRNRVESGGHDVPEEDVRRRFRRSLVNFFGVYETLVDQPVPSSEDNKSEK